ncbi:MAG: hypothetical protein HN413_01030 [Chloroflexi bacterium]|jgi:hypothetical protein|nr:hypothetical protein [Chloroflexota bacterium]
MTAILTRHDWNRAKWGRLKRDEPELAAELRKNILKGYTPEFLEMAIERIVGCSNLAKDIRYAAEYLWKELYGEAGSPADSAGQVKP